MGNPPNLVAMTCASCGKKLAEVKIKDGTVSVKCTKCGTINIVTTQTAQSSNSR